MGGGGETTTQSSGPPEWAQGYFRNTLDRAQQVANQPYQGYNQARVADFTSPQQIGMDMGINRALQGSRSLTNADNAVADTAGGAYLNSNPYLDSMFGNASSRMADAYARGTGANTLAGFNRPGAFGGSAHVEMTGANNRAFGDSLSNLASNIYGGNYAQERQNQLQAAGMAPGISNAQYQGADRLLGYGGQMQQQNQALLGDAYSRFQDARGYNQQQVDAMSRALGTVQGGTTTSRGPEADPFSQLLGVGLTAAQFFSDARLKTNIKKVGKTADGFNAYAFNYIWGGPEQIGVMAQEVLESKPEAVTLHPSGYLMVDYSQIGAFQ